MDKLTALQVFQRVAELKSFSAAARQLRLSNAAVSKNVRELEQELGVTLLQRTTRSVRLTSAGEEYLRRVAAIFEQLRDADESASAQATAPRGSLRVAAPMSFGVSQLVVPVATFSQRYPAVQVELELNDRFVDVVREGFDVAIRGSGPLPDSSLTSRKLLELERVVCASPAYLAAHAEPSHPRQLAHHRCLVYSLASSPDEWAFQKGKQALRVAVHGGFRVNSSLALVGAACAGLGVALVPRFAAEEALARGALRQVLTEWQSTPQALHALFPRRHGTSRSVRLFVDELCRHFAARR